MEQTSQPAPPEPAAAQHADVRVVRKTRAAGTALLVVAALVAVGGVTFALGRLTAPSAAAGSRTGFAGGAFGNRPNASGAPGLGGGGLRGGFGNAGLTIRGTVQSISSSTLVLVLENGQSVQIPLDTSTTYHRETAASAGDVQPGKTVQVHVSGGRVDNAPGSSPSPNASGAPQLGTARDVMVVTP